MSKSSLRRLLLPHKIQLPPLTDGWYGRASLAKGEQPPPDDPTINRFNVNISAEELVDLKKTMENRICLDYYQGGCNYSGYHCSFHRSVVCCDRTVFCIKCKH